MKFVIVAPARSGSTLIRTMLNQHPDICCHGEVFGLKRVLGISHKGGISTDADTLLKARSRNPVQFLNEQVYGSALPTVGFKLLYSQLFHLAFAPAMETLAARQDVGVVFLWRRDLISRHASEVKHRLRAAQRGDLSPAPDLWAVQMKPGVVERSCESVIATRKLIRRIFSDRPSIDIAYEDFIARHTDEARRLCGFLRVDPARLPPLPTKEVSEDDPAIAELPERMKIYGNVA